MDIELAFQTRHESWSFNRTSALKSFTSSDAYREALDLFLERQHGNEYAFGTPCSLRWLFTDMGLFEYILLKFQMGQRKYQSTPMKAEELSKIKTNDPDAWADLKLRVLQNDFPASEGNASSQENPGTQPSSPTEGPTPSTAVSGHSSPSHPGITTTTALAG